MSLSASQLHAISLTERVASAFSVAGTFFIFGTFLLDKAFHKPINRLVFYASWGNMMANVATLISQSSLEYGSASPLCQLQSFLIQMYVQQNQMSNMWLTSARFMPADALWMLALATNVYLTFFHKYGETQLRALEWRYLLLCYGVPFVPALVYIFVHTAARGKIYGSATVGHAKLLISLNFMLIETR